MTGKGQEPSVPELVDAFRTNRLAGHAPKEPPRAAARPTEATRHTSPWGGTEQGRAALRELLEDPELVIQIDVAGRLWPDPQAEAALTRWAQTDDVRGKQAAFVLKFARLAIDDTGSGGTAPTPKAEAGVAERAPSNTKEINSASEAEESVVQFHSLVMDGGIDHAIDASERSVDQVLAALRNAVWPTSPGSWRTWLPTRTPTRTRPTGGPTSSRRTPSWSDGSATPQRREDGR